MRLLHKFKGRDIATFMDLYDKEVKDEEGENYNIKKADDVFFERLVGILPVQIKFLYKENLVRVLEVLVKRNLGSDRLLRDYLLLKLEKNNGI